MSRGAAPEIREIHGDQWAEYRDLRLRALATDPRAFGSTLEEERAFSPDRWQKRLDPGTGERSFQTWVASDSDSRLVGMVVAARLEGQFHVFAMWVAPDHRGHGLGRGLLDRALAWIASIDDRASVQLEVNSAQIEAVGLYESAGFRATGRSRPIGHTPGVMVQEMVRRVGLPDSSRLDKGRIPLE